MSRIVTLLLLAAVALTSACAARGAVGAPVPQPFPKPASAPIGTAGSPVPPPVGSPASPASSGGYEIAGTALSLRGVPYRNGGSDPSGFDCSGFVWYVFAQHGLNVPRSVADQFRAGQSVGPDRLEPGDLVFFNTKGAGPSHVGMVIGGDEFVHAPSSTGEVRVERLGSSYWSSRLVGARRVIRSGELPPSQHSSEPPELPGGRGQLAATWPVILREPQSHAARCCPLRVSRRALVSVKCRIWRSSWV